MDDIVSAVILLLAILAVASTITAAGIKLIPAVSGTRQRSFAFLFGSSYFVGLSIFMLGWKAAATLCDSATIGLVTVILMFLAIAVFPALFTAQMKGRIQQNHIWEVNWPRALPLVFGFLLFILFYCFLSLVPMTDLVLINTSSLDPWQGATTIVHGFRAANISIAAANLDVFPSLKQNIGQSALAEIPLLMGLNGALFSLSIWMSISLFAFFILTIGIFQELQFTTTKSALAAAVLFLSATGISGTYSSMTDVGSVIFLIRNVDVVIGLGIFIFFLIEIALIAEIDGGLKLPPRNWVLLMSAMAFSLSFVATHLAILSCLVLFFVFTNRILATGRSSADLSQLYTPLVSNLRLLVALSPIVLFAWLGSHVNGFQMIWEPNLEVPPFRAAPPSFFQIRALTEPELFVWPNTAWYALDSNHYFSLIGSTLDALYGDSRFDVFGYFRGAEAVVALVKGAFFPILGLLIFPFLLCSKNTRMKYSSMRLFYIIALSLFVLGAVMSVYLDFDEYSREITRFWQPGIYLGTFFLVYSAFVLVGEISRRNMKSCFLSAGICIVVSVSLVSPSLEVTRWLYGNWEGQTAKEEFGGCHHSENITRSLTLQERLHFLLNHHVIVRGPVVC